MIFLIVHLVREWREILGGLFALGLFCLFVFAYHSCSVYLDLPTRINQDVTPPK
jgi:hypothetical protein